MSTSRVSWFAMVSALATSGCLSQSHVLLEETDATVDADGGATEDTGPQAPFWTDCTEVYESEAARHMDACDFRAGAECNAASGLGGRAVMCLEGHVLLIEALWTGYREEESCAGSIEHGGTHVEVVSVGDGCVELATCRELLPGRVHLSRACQLDPLPAVRDDAVGMTPWIDCTAALRSGTDGDPCSGAFRCIESERVGALSPFLGVCDAGIFRMFPIRIVLSDIG